jgi:hypothetical protein
MTAPFRRLAAISAIGLVLSYGTVVSTAISGAAECGPGTVYEAATDSCVGAPPPPPPPGDPTPGFSLGICAPIPFVALCTGI